MGQVGKLLHFTKVWSMMVKLIVSEYVRIHKIQRIFHNINDIALLFLKVLFSVVWVFEQDNTNISGIVGEV